MTTMQQAGLMAMGLTLGAGVLAPADAQMRYEVPTRLILVGDAMMQVAETEWAIRSNAPPPEARSSEIKSDGGIRYVSGGVGESERSELNAMASEFNLHLMFATRDSGEYLSAVNVNILDANNHSLLATVSKGPWFYAQLPPGHYTVEATPTGQRGEGNTQRIAVNLDGPSPSRLDFYWTK